MSERGTEGSIVIPIGFELDRTALENIIKEAQERFADALGTVPYAREREGEGERETATRSSFERVVNEVVSNTVVLQDQHPLKVVEELNIISKITDFGREIEETSTKVEGLLPATKIAGLLPSSTEEVQDISEKISSVSQDSVFVKERRISEERAFEDAFQREWSEWIRNYMGFREIKPDPFVRHIQGGYDQETDIESEGFLGLGLIGTGREAIDFMGNLLEQIGDQEFEELFKTSGISDRLINVLGGISQDGGISLGMMFDLDKLDAETVEIAEHISNMLSVIITESIRGERGEELLGFLTENVENALIEVGVEAEQVITAETEVKPYLLSRQMPPSEEAVQESDFAVILTRSLEVIENAERRAFGEMRKRSIEEMKGEKIRELSEAILSGRMKIEEIKVKKGGFAEEFTEIGELASRMPTTFELSEFSRMFRSEQATELAIESLYSDIVHFLEEGEIEIPDVISRRYLKPEDLQEELNQRKRHEQMALDPEGSEYLVRRYGAKYVSELITSTFMKERSHLLGTIRYADMIPQYEEDEETLLLPQRDIDQTMNLGAFSALGGIETKTPISPFMESPDISRFIRADQEKEEPLRETEIGKEEDELEEVFGAKIHNINDFVKDFERARSDISDMYKLKKIADMLAGIVYPSDQAGVEIKENRRIMESIVEDIIRAFLGISEEMSESISTKVAEKLTRQRTLTGESPGEFIRTHGRKKISGGPATVALKLMEEEIEGSD